MDREMMVRGCLLGLAVGDAMGHPIDKKNWDEITESYGPNGLLGYDLMDGGADVTSYTQFAAYACNGMLLGACRGHQDRYIRYVAMALREWAKCQQFRGVAEKTYCWVGQVPQMRRRLCMDTRITDAAGLDSALYHAQVGDVVTIVLYRSGHYYEAQLELIEAKGR